MRASASNQSRDDVSVSTEEVRLVTVAVVQAAPVLFDRERTLDKTSELVRQAQKQDAELVLFPEAFVPAYPRGLRFGMVVGARTERGRATWQRYWEQSVEVPSAATERLGEMAREAGLFLAIGVIERGASGTLYCTILYYGPDGTLLGKHRKLKPTAAERLLWGEGDGSTLTVVDAGFGKVGGLICWENLMPLARMAMYDKGGGDLPRADGRCPRYLASHGTSCRSRGAVFRSRMQPIRHQIDVSRGSSQH